MPKILLIVSSNKTGLQYYRQLMPNNYLVNTYDGFTIQQAVCDTDNFPNIPDDVLKNFDAIYFLRQISLHGRTKEYTDRCRRLGLRIFFDIDDYWRLPDSHPMYNQYKIKNIPKNVEEALWYSDVITTTNVWLQNKIKKFNSNVFVLKNCIDTTLSQFRRVDIKNNRLRFGWIGGVYHLSDISTMFADFYKHYKDPMLFRQTQICLGGYTLGQSEYDKIEKVMTDNYSALDSDYKKYLLSKVNSVAHYMNDKPYRRLFAKDVENYIKLYNEIDVSLIPLTENTFNSCKSELKLIEAGTMGKAAIVSEVAPYILTINKKNVLTVNRFNSFYDRIKYLNDNRSAVSDYANALSETIRQDYNIEKITQDRAQIYSYFIQ